MKKLLKKWQNTKNKENDEEKIKRYIRDFGNSAFVMGHQEVLTEEELEHVRKLIEDLE